MKEKQLRYYTTENGKTPFLEWFTKIKDQLTKIRIRRRLDRIELGNYGDYKVLGEGLCELRLDFGSGYRIYFTEQAEEIVMLLCSGDKSTQSADIETARLYLKELKARVYQ